MNELDTPIGADPDETRLLGRRERISVHQLQVRTCQRCRPQQRRLRLRGKARDTVSDERLQILGNGKHIGAGALLAVEQPGDLERVQRVAPRCLGDPDERRTRKRRSELIDDDPVQ